MTIALGALALMLSLAAGALLSRWYVTPVAAPRLVPPARPEVPLDDLLGPDRTRPYGAAVVQDWRDCPACARVTVGVVHADGWTCGECLATTGGGL